MKVSGLAKRIILSLGALTLCVIAFTLYANISVERKAKSRLYSDAESIPHNRVALLLGTNPLNRWGGANSYFTNRINTAAKLYHAGKADYIIVSGDNHVKHYDEPSAMRDSLMAHGVPEERIVMDYAGFRTLDSVVRAKEVFGCDTLTIISQADHCARALYLAEANGIEAMAIEAPLRAGRWVRTRLAVREWLARDKMMLDLLTGKQPHFLGERIEIQTATALPGKWKVKEYADLFSSDMAKGLVAADGNYTLRLDNTGTFWLTTDCNTVSGEYTTDSRRLKFLNAISTEMACDREFAEHRLKACISQTEKYDLPTDSTLRLLSNRNTVLIILEK